MFMKKVLLGIMALVAGCAVAGASSPIDFKTDKMMLNHLAASVHAGTTGFGLEVATPVTKYVAVRAGVSFMPNITFNTNATANVSFSGVPSGVDIPTEYDVDIKGGLGRTQGSLIFNVYPFTMKTPLYVAVGAYFGGSRLIKVTGHSDELESVLNDPNYAQYIDDALLQVGESGLPIAKDGSVSGGMKGKSFRPYVGIGWGSAIPKKLLNFNVELGVQFHGKLKVYSNHGHVDNDIYKEANDDTLNDIIDKFTVYPVLKFTLSGKIF